MKAFKIDYDKVIALGFERTNESDDVFFKQYGYQWFLVQLQIGKYIFDWDSTTMQVQLVRYDSKKVSANRVGTLKIQSLEQLRVLIDFLSSKKNDMFELPLTAEIPF